VVGYHQSIISVDGQGHRMDDGGRSGDRSLESTTPACRTWLLAIVRRQ
jgi:hypothetical protein